VPAQSLTPFLKAIHILHTDIIKVLKSPEKPIVSIKTSDKECKFVLVTMDDRDTLVDTLKELKSAPAFGPAAASSGPGPGGFPASDAAAAAAFAAASTADVEAATRAQDMRAEVGFCYFFFIFYYIFCIVFDFAYNEQQAMKLETFGRNKFLAEVQTSCRI
jgi:hypothetical protein